MSKTIAELLQEMNKIPDSSDMKQNGNGAPTAGTPQSSASKAGKWEEDPTTGEKMKAKADYENLSNKGSEQGRDEPENSTKKDMSKAVMGDTAKVKAAYNGGKPAVKEGTRVGHASWGEGIVLQVNEDLSFDALFEHGVEMNLNARKTIEEKANHAEPMAKDQGDEHDANRDDRDELEPRAEGEKAFYDAHVDNKDETNHPVHKGETSAFKADNVKKAPENKAGM